MATEIQILQNRLLKAECDIDTLREEINRAYRVIGLQQSALEDLMRLVELRTGKTPEDELERRRRLKQ